MVDLLLLAIMVVEEEGVVTVVAVVGDSTLIEDLIEEGAGVVEMVSIEEAGAGGGIVSLVTDHHDHH